MVNRNLRTLITVLIMFLLSFENVAVSYAATLSTSELQSPTGVTILQTEQALQTSQNLVDSKNAALTVTSSTPLTAAAIGLYNALVAAGAQSNMNLLYGTNLKPTGGVTATYDKTVFLTLTGNVNYDQKTFLDSLKKSADLYKALQANSTKRAQFNRLYKSYVPGSGSSTDADRVKIMNIASDLNYNQTNFMNALTSSATAQPIVPHARAMEIAGLYSAIQFDSVLRANINLLYGTSFAATGTPSTANKAVLVSIAGVNTYIRPTYLASVNKAGALYKALQSDSLALTAFNAATQSNIQASGAASSADRTKLFTIVSAAGYDLTTYLNSQVDPDYSNLYNALMADSANRADMNLLYGTSFSSTGTNSASDKALLNTLISASGYNQQAFLISVTITAGLYKALQADAVKRDVFNERNSAFLLATGSPMAADLVKLYGVTSVAGYNQAQYLSTLVPPPAPTPTPTPTPSPDAYTSLYNALLADGTQRMNMNLLYGMSFTSSGFAGTGTYEKSVLDAIITAAGYDQAAYLASLKKAADLYKSLQANSTLRAEFNSTNKTWIPATGSPTVTDRIKVFAVANTETPPPPAPDPTPVPLPAPDPTPTPPDSPLKDESVFNVQGTMIDGALLVSGGKVGAGSVYLDGDKDSLVLQDSAALDFGTGDFTIELWAQFADLKENTSIFGRNRNSGLGDYEMSYSEKSKVLVFGVNGMTAKVESWSATTNSWYHLAVVRSQGALSFYVNGSQIGNATANSSDITGSNALAIGADIAGYWGLKGHIDEFRISKNARWTSSFTPNASAYTVDNGTNALFHFESASPVPGPTPTPTPTPEPAPTPTPTPEPPASGTQLFSPTSIWNQALGSTTIQSNSATLVNTLVAETKQTQAWINMSNYSTPVYKVDSSTPKVPVSIVQGGQVLTWTVLNGETQKGVPIPANAVIAGGTDGHITIWDTEADRLYEFWQIRNVNGNWQASWGGIIDNVSTSNGAMPVKTNSAGGPEYWGATATGLPAVGGTIMIDELAEGVIPHALALAMINPKNTFVSPATRSDGANTSANAVPEGTRFRFPANIVINPSWTPMTKMMVAAVRDYGLIVRDRAGATVFYAEDPRAQGLTDSTAYAPYYGGKQLWDVVNQFPWDQLQVVAV